MKIVTKKIAWTGVSHDPDIKKQVFIAKDRIPHLTNFSKAVFKPGQKVKTHKHPTMCEVFYVLDGKAIFTIEGKEIEVGPEDCIIVDAGKEHSQNNPFDENVTWIYFGIATD